MNNFKPGALYETDKRNFSLVHYQDLGATTVKKDLSALRRLYQNGWPSCGAHAGDMLKMIQEYIQSGEAKTFSSDYLWVQIKKIDGFPLEAGTSMINIFKALKNKGICDYDLLPYDYSLNLKDYSSPSRVTTVMDENAKAKGISNYGFLEGKDLTIENLTQAININGAMLLLISCDDGFFGTNNPTFTQKKYGHFVVAVDTTDKGFKIIDSTEYDSTKADKIIPYTAFGFIRQAGVAIDLPDGFKFTNNLYLTLRNSEVKELQKRLGMTVENQTGYFGFLTLAAVVKYQKENLLPTTGFVGAMTRVKLNTT